MMSLCPHKFWGVSECLLPIFKPCADVSLFPLQYIFFKIVYESSLITSPTGNAKPDVLTGLTYSPSKLMTQVLFLGILKTWRTKRIDVLSVDVLSELYCVNLGKRLALLRDSKREREREGKKTSTVGQPIRLSFHVWQRPEWKSFTERTRREGERGTRTEKSTHFETSRQTNNM